ncbi:MAG: hypothetical protein AB7H90_01445 [Alphaproteobacteria bacterium]
MRLHILAATALAVAWLGTLPQTAQAAVSGACGVRYIAPAEASYTAGANDDGSLIGSANATGAAAGWAAASLPVTLPMPEDVVPNWTICFTTEANKAVVIRPPSLAAPSAPALSQTTGGTLTPRTYYVRITYTTAGGETLPSNATSLAVSANNLLFVSPPTHPGLGGSGWNVYVGTAPGSETKQNATPLSLGSNWNEPLGGLISGDVPPVVGNAPAAYLLVGDRTLSSLTVGPGNYQHVTVQSDGDNFRIVASNTETLAMAGATTKYPSRIIYPGGPGYQTTQADNSLIVSSGATASGLAITLPSITAIAAGWNVRFLRDAGQPLTVQTNGVSGGTIAYPGGTAANVHLAPYDSEYLELNFDGAVFRVSAWSAATATLRGGATGEVATNAALKLLRGAPGARVVRRGFAAAGDGGGAVYDWSASECTVPDDGAQVQPTAVTGCWVADFAGRTPTPKVWGAAGNGSTDDTLDVQAAITAMAGKTLHLGPYRYCIGAPGLVTYHPINIIGENPNNSHGPVGSRYGLVACDPNINMLTFTKNAQTASNGSRLSGVFFDAGAAGANSSGAAIVNDESSWVHIEHVRISKACIGIDERSSNSNKVEHSLITSDGVSLASGCGGVRVGNGTTLANTLDFRFIDNTIDARGDYGILVQDAGGMFIRGVGVLFSVNGLVIRPGTNQHVNWLYAESSALSDSTCSTGLVISTAAASAVVTGLHFSQTWTSSAGRDEVGNCTGDGISISNSSSGLVKGIHFIGHRSYSNGRNGLYINDGVSDVTFDNGAICANSTVTADNPSALYSGAYLESGVTGVALRNNRIGASCVFSPDLEGFQAAGIFLGGNNADLMITGNDLRGNAVAALSGPAGVAEDGKNIILNNAGVDNAIDSIAGAAEITLTLAPLGAITGSGATIEIINGMWDGREAKLYMRDGTNTFDTGGNLCNSGTFPQYAIVTLTRVPGASCSTVQ